MANEVKYAAQKDGLTAAPVARQGGIGNLGPQFTGMDNSTVAPVNPGTGSSALAAEVVKATFDKAIAWKARIEPMYRSFANIRPGSLVHAGTGIDMFRMSNDLAVVEAPLDEYADPDAVPLTAPEKITLVANEYGNATVTTLRLREHSWADIDPIQIELVARNMRDSIDLIYQKVIYGNSGGFSYTQFDGTDKTNGGTGAFAGGFEQLAATGAKTITGKYANAGAALTAATASLDSSMVRQIVAHFRNNNVPTFGNGTYLCLITPDAAVKLREETDLAGWRYPHLDGSQSGPIWQNTVGTFEGVTFLEGPKYAGMKGTAAAAADVIKPSEAKHNLLFLGANGLAETVIREPGAVVMPQVDRFNRFLGVGFYAFLGAGVYDTAAGVKIAVTV